MRYLLDTDAFSDLIRGVPNVKARFSLAGLSPVRISNVTIKEIEYARQRYPERVTRRGAIIDPYLQEIEALPFPSNEVVQR
jgi:predicted nucleic acid-binding protein